MLELIGLVVVLWIGFVVLRGVLRGASRARSAEFEKEASRIAIKSLGVPQSYHHYVVQNKMDGIRSAAQYLPDHDENFKNSSWPRLIALVVYGEFHQDCEQWQSGNPISDQVFRDLNITNDVIAKELSRNPTQVLYNNA